MDLMDKDHNWPFNKPQDIKEELLDIYEYLSERNLDANAVKKVIADRLYHLGYIPINDIEKFLDT